MEAIGLKPFDFTKALARAGLRPDGTPISGGSSLLDKTQSATGTGSANFAQAMSSAISAVSDSQNETQRLQQQLQLGNPTVSLEQTMVSMQKSQLGFQAVMGVRNRLVQSYTEIMNMQV